MAGRRRCWCIDDFRDGELTPTNIDVMECSRLQPAFRGKSASMAAGLRYHASIPLYFQDKPLGIMNVTGPEWRKLTRRGAAPAVDDRLPGRASPSSARDWPRTRRDWRGPRSERALRARSTTRSPRG